MLNKLDDSSSESEYEFKIETDTTKEEILERADSEEEEEIHV